jgi:hypothetical protein
MAFQPHFSCDRYYQPFQSSKIAGIVTNLTLLIYCELFVKKPMQQNSVSNIPH